MSIPVIIKDRFYVGAQYVDMRKVRAEYDIPVTTKELCRPGCPLARKPGRYCTSCPSRDAKISMWERKETANGRELIALPSGDTFKLRSVLLRKPRFIDKRPAIPFRSKLKWTGSLRRKGDVDEEGRPVADQVGMVRAWRDHVNKGETGGVIVSPPRTGKTVIGVRSSLVFRERAFITASQIDFLRQFGKRFGENTNLRELYRAGKRPVVLIDPKMWPDAAKYGVHVIRKWGPDVDRADIVMSTYQQFINPKTGHKRLRKYVSGKFSLAIVDEMHQANARAFSRVLNRANIKRRQGLTATVHRKDKLEAVCASIVGPVVIRGRAVSTLPDLKLFETGVQATQVHSTWNGIENFLSRSEVRNRLIVRQTFKDLRSDPNANVLIPVRRVAHVHEIVKLINQQASFCRQNKGERWPKELAVAYYGATDTNAVLNQIESGKARVTVANVKMVQHGLDQPRWSHVFIGVIPTSNAMLTWQLINRVCTPYPKELRKLIGEKPQPVAHLVLDEVPASVFCFAKVFKEPLYGYQAGINGTNFIEAKTYRMSPDSLKRAEVIAKYPRAYSAEDVGVKVQLGNTRIGKLRTKRTWQPKKSITRF